MNTDLRYECHHGRVVLSFVRRPANIDAMFRAAVERAGDRVAVVEGSQRLTYQALELAVSEVVSSLAALGVCRGESVAVLLSNRVEFLSVCLACSRLGAIFVPLGTRQRLPEIRYALENCGARVLIYENRLAAEVPDPADPAATPELPHRIVLDEHAAAADRPWPSQDNSAPDFRAEAVDEDAPFCILYTSGTTGRPKGAVLTHFGVIHSCLHYQHHLGLREGDCALLAVPASHVTGLVAILLATIRVAGRTVMMREFKAREFLSVAAAEQANYTLMVPAMYVLCLREPELSTFDLSSWRVGGFGGAPMPEAAIASLAARWPNLQLFNSYGATETTSPAVISPPGSAAARPDSIGRPVTCGELRIMDSQGVEVASGQSGEIWISGPMVVPFYWKNPQADAAAFAEGYWKSGDIGAIDAAGFVRLLDRKKDLINRGGYKVYSVEVENVLLQHHAVIEAAVVGSSCPVLGERVHAMIRADTLISAEELRNFCATRLADYKVPEKIHISREPLPRNANGKVLKAEIRARLERSKVL